jgi:hypothetical protein
MMRSRRSIPAFPPSPSSPQRRSWCRPCVPPSSPLPGGEKRARPALLLARLRAPQAATCLALLLLLTALAWTEFDALRVAGAFFAQWAAGGPPPRDPCAPCGCGGGGGAGAPAGACAADLAPWVERYEPGAAARLAASPSLSRLAPLLNASACAAAARAVAAGEGGARTALAEGPPPPPPPLPLPDGAPPAKRFLIHLYARPDLSPDLPPWQATTLALLLASQRPGAFRIVLWSPDSSAPYPPALAPFFASGAVAYRVFDPVAEAQGTPFEGSTLLRLRDRQAYADSDIFRLIALYKYGGVYLDLDVWVFRDLAPLLAWEWATEFSADHAAGAGALFNNAAVHFFAGSPAMEALAAAALHGTLPVLRSWAYGPHLLDRVFAAAAAAGAAPPFAPLPWCFFHGMWSVGDVGSPLREVGDEHVVGAAPWRGSEVLAAAWGLHLHGLPRTRAAAPGSLVDVLTRRFPGPA